MGKSAVIFLLGILSLFLSGCNVWEDRDGCPSYLVLDCSLLEGKAAKADVWLFRQDGNLDCRTFIISKDFNVAQRFQISRGRYLCIIWTDLDSNTITADMSSLSGSIYKAASKNADPVYFFNGDVECSKDSVCVRVSPRKMFINVNLLFKGMKANDNVKICLNSSWGGFNLAGEGIRQENSVLSEGRDTVRMRMLRPFSLDGINLQSTFFFSDGTSVDSDFDLGGFLEDNGYDLEEDMLKDIYITVDVSSFKTVIMTDPWQEVPPVTIRY